MLAVGAQHLTVGIRGIVVLVQEGRLQADSQGDQCERGEQHVQPEVQILEQGDDIHQTERGVNDKRHKHTRDDGLPIPPHSAVPTKPPIAAAVNGSATP